MLRPFVEKPFGSSNIAAFAQQEVHRSTLVPPLDTGTSPPKTRGWLDFTAVDTGPANPAQKGSGSLLVQPRQR
jgi:hypothetical protein